MRRLASVRNSLALVALVGLMAPGASLAQLATAETSELLGWPFLLEGPPARGEAISPGALLDLGVWRSRASGEPLVAEIGTGVVAAFAKDDERLVVAVWLRPGALADALVFTVAGTTASELAPNGSALLRMAGGEAVLTRPGAVTVREVPEALSARWTSSSGALQLNFGSRDSELLRVARFEVVFRQKSAPAGEEAAAKDESTREAAGPIGAATVDAVMTDALASDVDGDGRADPGDELRYTVTVGVTGGAVPAATFQDTLDAATTLVPASTNVSPLALDDAYSTLGNARLSIGSALQGLFANDREFLTDTYVLVSPAPGVQVSTAEGGTVTVAADGTFVYDPLLGFRGPTDSFAYTVQDGRGLTGTGSVTLNISGLVWFVDSEVATSGNGTLAAPFKTLAEAEGADSAGDTVYLLNRSGSAPAYTGGFSMASDERLAGQGVPLVVGTSTLVAATSAPTVLNASGSAITLASNAVVEGLRLSAANHAALAGSGNLGATTLRSVSVVTSGSGGGLGLSSLGGTVTFEGSISGTGSAPAVLVNGGDGTVTLSGAAIGKTGGRLVEVRNKTGGAVSFTDGSLSLTGGTGDAIVLDSNTGGAAVTFSQGLSVVTSGGRGLVVANSGTVTVAGTGSTVAATGGAALDASASTLGATFASLSSTGSTGHGLRLDGVAGSLDVGTTGVTSPSAEGILVQGSAGVFRFGNTSVTGGTAGVSVQNSPVGSREFASLTSNGSSGAAVALSSAGAFTVEGTTTVTNASGVGISVASSGASVSFGPTTLGVSTGTGLSLTNNAANDTSFSSLSVTTLAGPGIVTTNARLVNPAGTLTVTGGPMVEASGATFNSTFASATSTNSTSRGISLSNSSGTLSLGNGAITGPATAAVFVSGGSANVTFSGSVTQTTSGQRLVDVSATTGGTLTLSGFLTGGGTSTGVALANAASNVSFGTLALGTQASRMLNQAVTISDGSSAAIYSLGSVSIYTNGQPGLVTTNADGTLNVTSGRIDAVGSRAVDIDGPAGLTTLGINLTSVHATASTFGLRLQDTNGTFAVVGDGGTSNNGSGGIITNMTGADSLEPAGNGVYLRNATNVSLARLNINTNQNSGVFAEDVNGLTLTRCILDGNGSGPAALEGGLRFTRLLGTNTLSDSIIRNSPGNNVYGNPTSGTFTLTFTGGTIGPSAGGSGINIVGMGTSDMTLGVSGVLLQGHYVDGVQTSASGTARQRVNVSGSTCAGNFRCVDLGADENAVLGFDISSNTATGQLWQAFTVGSGMSSSATLQGFIRNNIIGAAGVVDSGSEELQGIYVDHRSNAQGIVSITGNTVNGTEVEGIRVRSSLDAGAGRLDATVRDNTIGVPDGVGYGGLYGAIIEARNTTNLCLDMAANDSAHFGTGTDFKLDQYERPASSDSVTFRLERFSGNGAVMGNVESFVVAQNISGSTARALGRLFTGVPEGTCLTPVLP